MTLFLWEPQAAKLGIGQCIIETHRPVISFTGPNYLHLYENIKIAKYHGAKIERK